MSKVLDELMGWQVTRDKNRHEFRQLVQRVKNDTVGVEEARMILDHLGKSPQQLAAAVQLLREDEALGVLRL